MGIIRADLHMHGPIGFQPYWLKKQRYAGKNLLKLILDESYRKRITISAITSQADEISRGSVHDRFYCLKECEAKTIPKDYEVDSIGKNILVVEKGDNRVYIVNGQTVMPKENGNRYDLLVVGSNQVPNDMPFRDTLNYCSDNGLISIAEHPYVETHRGMGQALLERHIEKFDAIEGHNSQAIFKNWTTKIPVIGGLLSKAGKNLNLKAKIFAIGNEKPYIATSDAHRIEDLGISYIEWIDNIKNTSEEKFIQDLRARIKSGDFGNMERYESTLSWFKWVLTFQRGIRPGKVQDIYIPSERP